MSHVLPRAGSPRRSQKGITLIELLIAMTIMAVLSSMIVGAWMSLQSSYAYSVKSADARGTARDTMARMRREVRDAMTQPSTGLGPIVVAENNHVQIMSAFNNVGGNVQAVDYWYRATGSTTGNITRKRGSDAEQIVAKNIVNVHNNTPLFKYSYIDTTGNVVVATSVGAADVPRILTVEIHILADVNPGHSPTYMDLISTVQPRNQRQF
jgi:prepilin-type N-terminal cleavage/methylation domain-containing protein